MEFTEGNDLTTQLLKARLSSKLENLHKMKVNEGPPSSFKNPVRIRRVSSDETTLVGKNVNKSSTELYLPPGLKVEKTVNNEDSFFNSFRDGLKQLGQNTNVNELRKICKLFAENNTQSWFIDAIENGKDQNNSIKRDSILEYRKNILLPKLIWGNPDVEGRILCDYFNVTLFVTEKRTGEHIYIHKKINKNGIKSIFKISYDTSDAIFIVNQGHQHFEPILNFSNKIQVKKGHTKRNRNRRTYSEMIPSEKRHVFETFAEIKVAIETGNMIRLKELIKTIYDTYEKTLLSAIYYENENPIRNTHLITLVCNHRHSHILDFLLNKSDILHYLPNKGSIAEKAYKQALCQTVLAQDAKMLEMLYDYWSGDLHWPASNSKTPDDIISNLKFLKRLLVQSRSSCLKILGDIVPVVLNNLIWFNDFQIKLYEGLFGLVIEINVNVSDTEVRKSEVEAVVSVIVKAHTIYEEYLLIVSKELDNDKGFVKTDYNKYLDNEFFHRKLDFNLVLLILNNLHLLKQRLHLPGNAYQNIESTLYYFLFRVNNDWKPYLPRDRREKKIHLVYFRTDESVKDVDRMENAPVIYHEWVEFRKAISDFITTLVGIKVEDNLRTRIPKEEFNILTSLPYMRDDYSLKKISNYIQAITGVDFKKDRHRSVFAVERALIVLGEFVKHSTTQDTCHLSSTTRGLLQAVVQKDIIKLIQDIRDEFSHAREGKLLKKIDLENNETKIFEDLVNDIFEIYKAIHEVIKLYKPVLEKNMVANGLQLLSLSADISKEKEIVNKFWTRFLGTGVDCTGSITANVRNLTEKWHKIDEEGIKIAVTKVPKYTTNILQKLKEMEEHNQTWNSLKNEIKMFLDVTSLDDYPNQESLCKLKVAQKTIKSKSVLNKIKTKIMIIKDCLADWRDIVELFNFIVKEVDIFKVHHWEIKRKKFIKLLDESIAAGHPDANGISAARKLIQCINEEAVKYCQHAMLPIPEEETKHDYTGFRNLAEKLKKNKFLTKTESDYLMQNINFSCTCHEISPKTCSHCCISVKIKKNVTLSVLEHRAILKLNVNEKCKKIVENLVIGSSRSSSQCLYLECLLNRAHHLDNLFEGCRDHRQLVLRYKFEQTFRIVIETLVSDIMNVFQEGWLKELANVRFSKMLFELPLRNILEHGNPHLEVIGSVLDPNDYPNALISFALDFMKDEIYLKDLFMLYEDEVDRHSVYCSKDLSPVHTNIVNNFKQCGRWKSYIKLLNTKKLPQQN